MTEAFIKNLLDKFYDYFIVGGIILILAFVLKDFAMNIALRIFIQMSNDKYTVEGTKIYVEREWWTIRKIGIEHVDCYRLEGDEIVRLKIPLKKFWDNVKIFK